MNVLYVHQNFPGQYKHLVSAMAADPAHRVHFLTQPNENRMSGVERIDYTVESRVPSGCHPFTAEFDRLVTTGAAAAEALRNACARGYRPDLIVGHAGWGELLYLREVCPDTPILANFEFYYHGHGHDVGFDPEFESVFNGSERLRTRNAGTLLTAEAVDWSHSATFWQKGLHPAHLQARMSVLHEGVDTRAIGPRRDATYRLDSGRTLTATDRVITYVARNLEPYRGFHTFMRALPRLQRRFPKAEIVIVGGDGVSYGAPHAPGSSFRAWLLEELGDTIDRRRIHFEGQIAYDRFLSLLQVSSAHVYLSYPFVLSWSFVEAMAAGCVVIGSSTPSVLEVLEDGVNGLAVDFFDGDALVEAVATAFTRRRVSDALRAGARRTAVERYDLHGRQLPAWQRLFADLVAGRPPDTDHG